MTVMATEMNMFMLAVILKLLLDVSSTEAGLSTAATEIGAWTETTTSDVDATTRVMAGGRVSSGSAWTESWNGASDGSSSSYTPTILDTRDETHSSSLTTSRDFDNSQSDFNATTKQADHPSPFVWRSIEWTWVLILQLISGIVGTVGNFLVIVVLFQRRRKSRSTDTLIFALAWADFLTSIFIIPLPSNASVPHTWLGQLYCRIVYTNYLLWLSITASAYILMALSVERYLAVVYPLYFKRFVNRRQVVMFIGVIILLSVVSGLYIPFVYAADASTNTCTERYLSLRAQQIISYYWFCLRLVIPCLTMAVTQVLIARELKRQFLHFRGKSNIAHQDRNEEMTSFHLVARYRVIKMMVIVIFIYIICWTPNQIAYLGYNLGWVPASYLGSTLHDMFTVLGFYNSCANPIIYAARFPEFRHGLKAFFTCTNHSDNALFEIKEGKREIAQPAIVLNPHISTAKI